MSSAKRGLGRGFDALIPTDIVEQTFDPTAATDSKGARVGEQVVEASPDQVSPNPHQPRQDFNPTALASLASSIKAHGILQPLVVTQVDGGYQLIAGERRLRAAKQAGLTKVPLIVRSYDEQTKLELALIENLQRADLNPMETATAYRKLSDQFNLRLEDMSKRVGRDITTISNTMRLLGLPPDAKRAVSERTISEGHARVILSVPNAAKQAELLKLIMEHSWSVRQAEEFARALKPRGGSTTKGFKRLATTNELTEAIGQRLKAKVTLQNNAKGGRLIIQFDSERDLERIRRQIEKS